MIYFFIRRYNDIDHIVPIVYRFVKDGNKNLIILCLHLDYDIKNDWRLNYLRQHHDVEIDYVHNYFKNGLFQIILLLFIRIIYKFNFRMFFNTIISSKIWIKTFNEKWIEQSIIKFNPLIMIFDWHKIKVDLVKYLINASKKYQIKVIGVPHGGHPFTNKLWTNEMYNKNEVVPFGLTWASFDKVILQDYNHSKFVQLGGYSKNNIQTSSMIFKPYSKNAQHNFK